MRANGIARAEPRKCKQSNGRRNDNDRREAPISMLLSHLAYEIIRDAVRTDRNSPNRSPRGMRDVRFFPDFPEEL